VKTINLSVDENTLEKAEKIARANRTSVSDLLLDYLHQVTSSPPSNEAARRRLVELSNAAKGEIGTRDWTRDDLYAR
jgi:hypothetical protein